MKEEAVSFLVIFETFGDKIERMQSLIGTLCEIARDEYKCLRFDVFQDAYAHEKFIVLETWPRQKNWEQYLNSSDFHTVMDEIDKLLLHPIQAILLSQLSNL